MSKKKTDNNTKISLCECDCKVAIKNIIAKYDIDTDDYTEVLTEIKEWIEYIIKN